MTLVKVTKETIDDVFEGVMIDVKDPFVGPYSVPGWRCRACGWTVGSEDLPPSHECPAPGPPDGDAYLVGGGPFDKRRISCQGSSLVVPRPFTSGVKDWLTPAPDEPMAVPDLLDGRYSPDADGPPWLWRWRGWEDE